MPRAYVLNKNGIIKIKKNHPLRVFEISINRVHSPSHAHTPRLPHIPHHVDRDRRKTGTLAARNEITRTDKIIAYNTY